MTIDKDSTEKYLDIVIKEIIDVTFFSINNTLIENNHFNPKGENESRDFHDLAKAIKTLGITYGYFEKLGNGSWYKLTEIGLTAKEKGGHFKYQKSLKKKTITLFEKISIFFLIISFAYNFYQDKQKNTLENENKILKVTNDSLNRKLKIYKDSIQAERTNIVKLKSNEK
jgi:hypothetical protein